MDEEANKIIALFVEPVEYVIADIQHTMIRSG